MPPLEQMTLKQKIGHVLMPRLAPAVVPQKGTRRDRLTFLVQEMGISLFYIHRGGALDTAHAYNVLQSMSDAPVLLAGDFEMGAGQNISGATLFPPAMAIGHSARPDFARETGRITALECCGES